MASRSPVVPECCIRTTAKTQETFSKTAPVNISNRTSCVVINGYEMRIEKTQETPVTVNGQRFRNLEKKWDKNGD